MTQEEKHFLMLEKSLCLRCNSIFKKDTPADKHSRLQECLYFISYSSHFLRCIGKQTAAVFQILIHSFSSMVGECADRAG